VLLLIFEVFFLSLQFNTKYFYKIGIGNTTREFSFSTPPRPGLDTGYTFGIIGMGTKFISQCCHELFVLPVILV